MYRLISATPSPYARKVRIQLIEKDIPFDLVTEVPWDSTTRTPQHNPLEKLPVLICDDGTSVFESRYINEWVEMMHPEPPLVPKDRDGILAVKRFEILGDGICDALVLMFWENNRDPSRRSPEWYARQERKLVGGLAELSRVIGDKAFAWGETFTQADISVATVLRYLDVRWPDNPWRQQHPNLAAYSDRMEKRPSFAATVPVPQIIRDKVA